MAARKNRNKNKKVPVQEPPSESSSSSEEDETSEEEEEEEEVMNIDEVEQEADDSDDSEEEEEEEDDDDDSEENSTDEESDIEEEANKNKEPQFTEMEDNSKDENDDEKEYCNFDLRNLLVMNTHQMDIKSIYHSSKSKATIEELSSSYCIPNQNLLVKEDYLLQKASVGCQQLIHALWQLPTERTDVGPLASLPSAYEIVLPRQLPPPEAKAETKWEKFAKERGIQAKSKRSRKVYDEATDSWKHLTGPDKANSSTKEWPIMEVKRGDDPYMDPWEKARDAHRTKMDKQMENRMRNQERAGKLPKGTTTRFMKDKHSAVEKGKEGHQKGNVVPSGIPVDLRPRKAMGNINPQKRGEMLTKRALLATQRSTASLGKFDQMREGEPEKKNPIRKRKFDSVADKKVMMSEKERGMKVLERIVNGGKQKDKDVRKGMYAKGETAYDYDYDDGLGPSSFKKKKGRAGAGKMKKITKKRAK